VCVKGGGGGLLSAVVFSFNLNLFQYTRLMRNNGLCLGSGGVSLFYLMSTLSDRLLVFFFSIINHESVRRNKRTTKTIRKPTSLLTSLPMCGTTELLMVSRNGMARCWWLRTSDVKIYDFCDNSVLSMHLLLATELSRPAECIKVGY